MYPSAARLSAFPRPHEAPSIINNLCRLFAQGLPYAEILLGI